MRLAKFLLVASLLGLLPVCSNDTDSREAITLEITTPQPAALVATDRVRIAGTATGVDEVEVEGELADVVGDEWEAVVPLSQGEVTVAATAGGVTDEVTFTIDSVAPKLELTSPDRAVYVESIEATTVTVSGSVSDSGVGLETLKVDEQILEVADDGTFTVEWPVEPGYHRIVVTAIDLAGNETDAIRGTVVGRFADPTEPLPEAFSVFVDEAALAEVEEVIAGIVTPEFVEGLVAANFNNANIEIDSITFDPIEVTIDPNMGVIDFNLVITNVEAEGALILDPDRFDVVVELARAEVTIGATPVVLEDGSLDLQFAETTLDIAEEDLTYTVAGEISQDDTAFLREQIVNFARRAFGDLVASFVLAELYDPDVLEREIELLGRTVTINLAFEEITVLPDGILARLSVEMPADAYPEVRTDAPGALANPLGRRTAADASNDILFTTDRLVLDYIFHGVWRSGLLHQVLTDGSFAGFELPIDFTISALAGALDPAIANLAPPGTPVGLRLQPQFPPFIRLDSEANAIRGNLGEFILAFVLEEPGQEPLLVASTALFVDLTIGVSLEGYTVKLDLAADLRADLAEIHPDLDIAEERVEGLFEDVGVLIPDLLSDEIDITGVSDLTWVILESPQIEVHGEDGDYLTASLRLIANPEGFASGP